MELIRISDRKMKIMLTPNDMNQFELNGETFLEDSQKMHRAFRLLLEEVKKRTGFDADDRQISVQYFPSKEGGCEMFISHLPADGAQKETALLDSGKGTALRPAGRKSGFRRECAYRFDALDDLLSVCRRMNGIPCLGESSAYLDERGKYYLAVTVHTSSPFSTPEELSFITEYGTVENAGMMSLYISEHGKCVCRRDAVRTLAKLA